MAYCNVPWIASCMDFSAIVCSDKTIHVNLAKWPCRCQKEEGKCEQLLICTKDEFITIADVLKELSKVGYRPSCASHRSFTGISRNADGSYDLMFTDPFGSLDYALSWLVAVAWTFGAIAMGYAMGK